MNIPFIKLVGRSGIKTYDDVDSGIRFRMRESDLWIGNRFFTMGLRFTEDAQAHYLCFASLADNDPRTAQNIWDRTDDELTLWPESLRLHHISWETKRHTRTAWTESAKVFPTEIDVRDGRDRSVTEAYLTFHLIPREGSDHADELVLLKMRWVSDAPFLIVQRDLPNPVKIKQWTEAEGIEWDMVQRHRFPMAPRHYSIKATRLEPNTDFHDQPVRTETLYVNPRTASRTEGEQFIFKDLANGRHLMLVREAMPSETLQLLDADVTDNNLRWDPIEDHRTRPHRYHTRLTLIGRAIDPNESHYVYGDRVVLGIGQRDLADRYVNMLRWELLRDAHHGFNPERVHNIIMRTPRRVRSSTIGQATPGTRRHELDVETIKAEIIEASQLGVDIYELDASIGEGAIAELQAFAQAQNVILRLCYIPNPTDDYAHLDQDYKILKHYQTAYGISSFRFQDVVMKTERGYGLYTAFLSKIVDEGFHFSQDTRSGMRPWLSDKPGWGALRPELRTAEDGTYYPMPTIRKLWELSQTMPAERLEMGVEDPKRFPEWYRSDPFGLARVDIDYMFFAVAAATPVIQFDPRGLSHEDKETIKEAIKLYRDIRPALQRLKARAVGKHPDGRGTTGFAFMDASDQIRYLIVLKGAGENGSFTWSLPGLTSEFRVQCLMTNATHRPALEIGYKEDDVDAEGDENAEVTGNIGALPYRYAIYVFEPTK